MAEPKYSLKPEDYFSLWKQFQEDADKVKDKLWTITSWLYALMGGLMVFLLERQNPDKILILFGAGIGVLLSFYTWYMIKEFGGHIQNHWDRADFTRKKINGLIQVWKADDKIEEPKESEESKESKEPKEEKNAISKSRIKFFQYLTVFLSKMRHRVIGNAPPFAQRLMFLAIGYGLAFVLLALYLMLFPPSQITHHERTTSCTQRSHPQK